MAPTCWAVSALIAVLAMAVPARPSFATVVAFQDLPALAKHADLVVRGIVLSSQPERLLTGRIRTRSRVRVLASWKGGGPSEVTVITSGGALDDGMQIVTGAPRLSLGSEALLFLTRIPGPEALYAIEGFSQGYFPIARAEDGTALVIQSNAGIAAGLEGGRLARLPSLAPTREETFRQLLDFAFSGGTAPATTPAMQLFNQSPPALARPFIRSTLSDDPKACLYWNGREVPYTLSARGSLTTGTSAFPAVHASFHTWSTVACSDFQFSFQGTSDLTTISADATNLVIWRQRACSELDPNCTYNESLSEQELSEILEQCRNAHDCWASENAGVIALTTTSANRYGVIVDADIELNEADWTFAVSDNSACGRGCYDTQNVLTHEIGHVVGLADLYDLASSNATMFNSAGFGETSKRSLDQDDIDGICTIYPRGGPTAACYRITEVAVGSGCAAAGIESIGPMGFLGLVVLLRRRPKRSLERGD